MEILIGADPEFFVKKDGKHVSAYGLIPGTKKEPHKVINGAVQVDGMALEFNINPARDAIEFCSNIQTVIDQLRAMVPTEYEFDFSSVAHFGDEYIQAQPEEAKILGCEPDFNAYTGKANPRPDGNMPFRTASGHIHVGWTSDMDVADPEHIEACRMVTKQLDTTLGLLNNILDPDPTRRQLYGKAGAHRIKSYGVEYRVMSNAWLRNPLHVQMIYDLTHESVNQLLKGNHGYSNTYQPYVNGAYSIGKIYSSLEYNISQNRTHIKWLETVRELYRNLPPPVKKKVINASWELE